MKALLAAGGLLALTTAQLFGQGGYRPYGYANRSGFGSVLFPGTGGPPPIRNPFSIADPGFASRLSGNVSGFRPYRGGGGRHGYGGVVAVPVPVVVGGYGYYDGYSGYEQPPAQYPQPVQGQPNITIVLPPQPAPNQAYYQGQEAPARPSVREYGPEDYGKTEPGSNVRIYQVPPRAEAPAVADEPVMFLIALKDNSIYTASAYWVEGDTLHYITTRGEHNQVSLDLVDRETSAKLNRGRKAEFRLPPPK